MAIQWRLPTGAFIEELGEEDVYITGLGFYDGSSSEGTIFKVWNGSAWIDSMLKRWNGSSWVDAKVQKWSGTEWVPV